MVDHFGGLRVVRVAADASILLLSILAISILSQVNRELELNLTEHQRLQIPKVSPFVLVL